jgi:hypothetical protein
MMVLVRSSPRVLLLAHPRAAVVTDANQHAIALRRQRLDLIDREQAMIVRCHRHILD